MSDWGPFALDGRIATVTGGSRGIGRGIATRLAEAGASVVIADLEPPADLDGVSFVHVDLAAPQGADQVVERIVTEHGRLDIVVNNVGIFPNFDLENTDADIFDRFANVNLRSHLLMMRAFAVHVASREPGGKVINIASIDALKPSTGTGHAAYGAVKAGVLGLTYQTARELSHLQIRVNAICPGIIMTEGVATTTGRTPAQLESVLAGLLPRVPVGRFGRPDDIATAAVFLASPASDFITGQHLVVDGGFMLT